MVNGGQAGTSVGDLNVELLGTLNESDTGTGTDGTADGGAPLLVLHHEGLKVSNSPDDGLELA